jgi:hypothetical protein
MREYWAALETESLVRELSARVRGFHNFLSKTGLSDKWKRSEDLYFGKHMDEPGVGSGNIQDAGDKGEIKAFGVNHYRNLIKHIMALTTSTRPSYDPRAKNSDTKSQQQARLASQILDAYLSDKRLGRPMSSAAERSLVYSKGFVHMYWDPSLGKPYSTQPAVDKDGQPIVDDNNEPVEKIVYEGDADARAKSPFDVIYDPKLRDWSKNKWAIVRDWENKWDLAARYPEKAEIIKGLESSDDLDEFQQSQYGRFGISEDDDFNDYIPVYRFYHLRTDAVPNGRYMIFTNGDLCLYDGPTPYRKKLPVFRICPGEVFDTSEGYTDSFDIMALQEVVNVLYSIPFSNQQAFALQAIWLPEGCEISSSQVGKGLAILRGGMPGTEPKPLQLTSTPAELFKNIEMVEGAMEKLSGINSVVRGDPEHNLKSGAALGRVQAMAIQFASNFQKSWAELQEDCGSFLMELLKDFAKTERMEALAGKANKNAMVSFTGDDLDSIDRVAVDLGNPLARTVAGRLELADKLLERGEINGKQYIQVAATGQLDSIFESKESGVELIKKENEMLLDGKLPKALISDMHMEHIPEHQTVLNDPQLRLRATEGDMDANNILGNTLAHVQEHFNLWSSQDPRWSQIKNEPPAAMPMPPPMPGPGGPMPMDPNAPPPPLQQPPGPQMAEPPPMPPMPEQPAPGIVPPPGMQ